MSQEQQKNYTVLAYYLFVNVADPHEEVQRHKAFCQSRDITARVYISEEGINGQMSAEKESAKEYMEWMATHPYFKDAVFKLQDHHEHVFPRLTIKYRRQLVALDAKADLSKQGEHVSPAQWSQMLEEGKSVLLDVRNDYEWQVGRFENAELPPCETFREFQSYADRLKERVDPKKTSVMMYCTGGIRCEIYSSFLMEKGFEKVYQLEGGVINYGQKEGSKHWLGKLFVFDDRLTIPLNEEKTPPIGHCHHCGETAESYYNCANMDCNKLFLCCPSCLEKTLGCCQQSCQEAPRRRPYHHQNPHKPFRKWYNYFPG